METRPSGIFVMFFSVVPRCRGQVGHQPPDGAWIQPPWGASLTKWGLGQRYSMPCALGTWNTWNHCTPCSAVVIGGRMMSEARHLGLNVFEVIVLLVLLDQSQRSCSYRSYCMTKITSAQWLSITTSLAIPGCQSARSDWMPGDGILSDRGPYLIRNYITFINLNNSEEI